VKYAWIEGQRGHYPVEAMCGTLAVSPSGLATWKRGGRLGSRLTDPALLALIRAIHAESKRAYGWPRVWRELQDRGIPAGKERVRKLMQANGIRGRHKRRYKATTDSNHNLPVAPNRLDRQFGTSRPDQAWTADLTYIATREGWLYLAVVMDLYTRMIVGWAMDARMTKELVIRALRMAYFRRKPKPGLIHHSDRGSQYCSHDYQGLLTDYGMVASMSRKGNCWDNAPMESFFNSLKNERVFHESYLTREHAKRDLFDYIEVFYNRRRRHSALNYQSPAAHYAAWLDQRKLAA
jgi:putative transposase